GHFTSACPNYVTATGTTSWSATLGSSALIDGSSYAVTVETIDNATNANTNTSAATATYVYDNTAPNTAVLTTSGNYNGAGFPANLTGTTTDSGTGGSGISAVSISIKDSTSNKCWNGTNFTTASCPNWVAVTSGGTATGSNNANWSYSTTGMGAQLTSGDTYTIQIQAIDATTSGTTSSALSAGT